MSLSLGLRLLLLALTTGVAVLGQSPGPNAIALINGQTSLDCVTTLLAASSWTRTSDGTNNAIMISVSCSVTGSNAAYYRTDVIGGNICRLIIANVTMQQAGIYDCFDGSSTAYRSLVSVIDPVANVAVHNQSAEVVDNDQLNISCSITYTGPSSPAPSLRPLPYWSTSPEQIYTNATYNPSINVVTLVATVRVQKPTVPIFHCYTAFEITGNTIGYNATAPADNFIVGSTTELDVQYDPSTPVVTSKPEVITINGVPCGISVLTCSSTGNPKPSYKWYDTTQQVFMSDEQSLTLAEVNRNYRCDSYNTIRNQLYLTSTTYAVSEDDSVLYLQNCKFPRNDSTSISVTGCDDSSPCVCSQAISITTSPTTTSPTKSSDSNSKDVAIAMGVLFGISLAINITVLILWLINHLRAKEDPLKRTENVRQSKIMDLRNGSSEPSAYEDLRRRDDTELQQSNYEKLSPNTTS